MATATKSSPITSLQALGQSVWMDYMSRKYVQSGELRRQIEEDDLRGVTSNPTIFEKAIGHSADYDQDFRRMVEGGADADEIYRGLSVSDIRTALDLFRPTYDRTGGGDGFVSLEVAPQLATDTAGTISEAKTLWSLLGRPNAMIKIPGTPEGLPAIEEALASGLNVNITLLFSVEAYEQVVYAYLRALRRRVEAGQAVDHIASVASFFVSRIDTEVDKRLDAKAQAETDPKRRDDLENLKGKAAIANAKLAYARYEAIFNGPEFLALKDKGARAQRLLWASTGTKNPKYPDTLYVDELIGPDTVNTMPPATFEAVKDHGNAQTTLTQNLDEARDVMERLAAAGIDFKDVTDQLLREGVASFEKSFTQLMTAIKEKRERFLAEQQ